MTEEALTPAQRQAMAARAAHATQEGILATARRMRQLWMELAEQLYRFHAARMWVDLGYERFDLWAAEVLDQGGIHPRYAYKLIEVYEALVIERGVPVTRLAELQVSKVLEVLPAIRREQVTVEEGLSDAETLRRYDLDQRYRGAQADGVSAGPDTSTAVRTEREPPVEPHYCRCPVCGGLHHKAG